MVISSCKFKFFGQKTEIRSLEIEMTSSKACYIWSAFKNFPNAREIFNIFPKNSLRGCSPEINRQFSHLIAIWITYTSWDLLLSVGCSVLSFVRHDFSTQSPAWPPWTWLTIISLPVKYLEFVRKLRLSYRADTRDFEFCSRVAMQRKKPRSERSERVSETSE